MWNPKKLIAGLTLIQFAKQTFHLSDNNFFQKMGVKFGQMTRDQKGWKAPMASKMEDEQ